LLKMPKKGGRKIIVQQVQPVFTGGLPSLNTNPTRKLTIRYAGAPSQNSQISRQCLLSLVTIAVNGSTTSVPLYTSVRVTGVQCYIPGNPSSTTRSPSLQFSWVGNEGPATDFSWVSIGTNGFKSPMMKPPKNSRCGLWSRAGGPAGNTPVADLTEVLFQFNKNNEDDTTDFIYVDLHLQVRSDTNSPAILTTTAGPITGVSYNALDCLTSTSAVGSWTLVPVNVTRSFATAPAAFTRSGG